MKTVDLASLPVEMRQLVEDAQQAPVIVTEEGVPIAVIGRLGAAGDDAPFWIERDPGFWAEIERRRTNPEPPVPLEDVIDELRREEG